MPAADVAAQAEAGYVGLPLGFEKNKGQTDDQVDFLARGSGYTVFLTGGDAVLRLGSGESSSVLRLDLVGADESARARGSDQLGSTANYMIGSDPEGWATGLKHFGSVTYENVWEGVDVRYYGNQRQLEYDFIVEAGADADVILIDFQGRSPCTWTAAASSSSGCGKATSPCASRRPTPTRTPRPVASR